MLATEVSEQTPVASDTIFVTLKALDGKWVPAGFENLSRKGERGSETSRLFSLLPAFFHRVSPDESFFTPFIAESVPSRSRFR
jgi:hypothetical protein